VSTVTLSEIAKKLGVSKTTVSRAFNNAPGARISEKMRDRIREACEKAGYQPNFTARALASSRTYVIGAVFINISSQEIGQLVEEAEHVASDRGYHLILCSTRADLEREKRECSMLRQRGVEGLIVEHVVKPGSTGDHLQAMYAANYPVVLTGYCHDAPELDYVGFNETAGMALATQALLDKGYRKIAFLGYHPDGPACEKRLTGYKKALKEADLSIKDEWIIRCDDWHLPPEGRRLAQKLLDLKDRPEAVICYTDHLACGVYQHFQEKGIRVPQDIAIMGYGNVRLDPWLKFPFPSVNLDMRQLGLRASQLLIQKIEENAGSQSIGSVEITPELVRVELLER